MGTSVAVNDHFRWSVTAEGYRHRERVFDEIGAHVISDSPTDHPATVRVDHGREVNPSFYTSEDR